MQRRNFYIILISLTVLGYSWIAFHVFGDTGENITLCLFKRMTSIPCPACGTSRSVLLLIDGDYLQAALLNPLGYVAMIGLVVLPYWLLFDFFFNRRSLYKTNEAIGQLFNNRFLLALAIGLILSNWVWNIFKEL